MAINSALLPVGHPFRSIKDQIGFTGWGDSIMYGMSDAIPTSTDVTDNNGELAFINEMKNYYPAATQDVRLFNSGVSGSVLLKSVSAGTCWYNDVDSGTPGNYNSWLSTVQKFTARGGVIPAMFMNIGLNDASNGSPPTYASVLSGYQGILSLMRTALSNASLPVGVFPIGRRGNLAISTFQNVRDAQKALVAGDANCYLMPEMYDLALGDSTVHPSAASNATYAIRVARKMAKVLGKTVTGGVDGPTINVASVNRSGSTITGTIDLESGSTAVTQGAVNGFYVTDSGGSAVTISSAVISGTSFTITTAAPADTGSTLYYGYGSIYPATSGFVLDNSAYALPLRTAKIAL